MAAAETLDVVDLADRSVGAASLKDCLEKGLLHRAVAVVVVRSSGTLLLQRRSVKDVWHPGRWTLSTTGHVRAGETYRHAAVRELSEELGIRARVRLLSKLLLPKVRSRGLIEWEHVSLFLCRSDQEAVVDTKELAEARALSVRKVHRMLFGRKLTPDAKLLLLEYFRLARDDSGPR